MVAVWRKKLIELGGSLADAIEERLHLAEAVCKLIAADIASPGAVAYQQIWDAWQRWRTATASMSDWRADASVGAVGARRRHVLKRLDLAERAIVSLQLLWSADYEAEYQRDAKALRESVADWQTAAGLDEPLAEI